MDSVRICSGTDVDVQSVLHVKALFAPWDGGDMRPLVGISASAPTRLNTGEYHQLAACKVHDR